MRLDTSSFDVLNKASEKEPRFVVSIDFPGTGDLYVTSHSDITNLPSGGGQVILQGVLQQPSAISQRIVPDEGRSEIGTFSFTLVDLASVFTDELRDRLFIDNDGLRGRTVQFFVGYKEVGSDPSFANFKLFQTQVVKGVSHSAGGYKVSCNDITRAERKDIFEPKTTTLRDSVDRTATTIPVYVTSDFSTVVHGTSWSDAPSSTVGYIRIDDEVIRYTGKTSDTFTGCTRGALNTLAVEHVVDAASVAERRPKVTEVIYLELPAIKLAYAVMTGTSPTLPAHWHLGIATSLIRDTDFTGIGTDLYDSTNDALGFITRFDSLTKTDGKKFLEEQIFRLAGVHQVIYSDGKIGLKRMNQVLSDSAYVATLDESVVTDVGELEHDLDGMHNTFQIDWNWNGNDFTRRTVFADAQSVDAHGSSQIKKLEFKGLHGSRHTEGILRKRIDALRDRYAEPPERITVSVLPSMNPIEIGDVVRLKLANVRDFAGVTTSIDRSFEVQRKSENFLTGDVTLELFGSTARPSVDAPTGTGTSLPDAFYNSSGVLLSSVVTIVANVTQAGTFNLTGNADLNNTGAIYYHLGDLEIASSTILTVNANVQLRIRGFLTINGDIDGIGRGLAGVADTGGINDAVMGTPGFLGNSRGMDGVRWWPSPRGTPWKIETRPARLTAGKFNSFPFLELTVSGNNLLGLPSDLRGTSGGPGEKVIDQLGNVDANGGTGANGGAGLAIICRGLAFGASGSVTLSGNSSAATGLVDGGGVDRSYPGSGGAGCPGGFFIGLDGGSLSLPDLTARFFAAIGTVPIQGDPMNVRERHTPTSAGDTAPYAGFLDPSYISNRDMSNAAHRIQYIPAAQTAAGDVVIGAADDSFDDVFLDEWNHGRWEAFYDNVGGNGGTVTYPNDGQYGGKVLQAAGAQIWIQRKKSIPYDPTALYRIKARVRRTSAGSGGAGTQLVWMGVCGLAADDATFINESGANSTGSQHYNCIRGFDMSTVTLNEWRVFTGYFLGHATSGFGVAPHGDAPTPLYTGVAYFRPLLIMNYNGGNGTQQCDYIQVERLVTPDDADNSDKKRISPDAEFARSTGSEWWYIYNAGGTAPFIQLTGGNYAGLASFTGTGNNKALISRRRPSVQAVTNELWTVNIRWRRTSTLTGSASPIFASIIRHDEDPNNASFNPYTGGIGVLAAGGVWITQAEWNARTVNSWYEDSAWALIVPGASYTGGSLPRISLLMEMDSSYSGGTIEIDYFNAIPGANGQPRERVFTGSATLGNSDLMMMCAYDSSSAGTFTMPSPSDDMVGARIYFEQRGTGLLTIAPGGAGSLFSPPNTSGNRALSGRYARAFAECRGATPNSWWLSGSLS